MRRFELKKLRNNHRTIQTTSQSLTTIGFDMDESTLRKLLSGEPFNESDITNCAKTLFEKYHLDFERQFRLAKKIDHLDQCLEDVELQNQQPIFVVFAKEEHRWVLFCIILENGKTNILYKDPCGVLISFMFEKKIKKIFQNVNLLSPAEQDQDEDDDGSYGPLTVRNLELLLSLFKQDAANFVKKFPEVQFSNSRHLNDYRLNEVVQLTTKMSRNEGFKRAFKTFVENLPLELSFEMLEYSKVLKEETGKQNVDYERISQARKSSLSAEKVKQFEEECKKFLKKKEDTTNNNYEVYEANIEKEFPTEMARMNDVFKILGSLTVNEHFYSLLRNICRILDIDYNKLEILYQLKSKKVDGNIKQEKRKLAVEDINAIVKKAEQIKRGAGSSPAPLSQATSLDEIMQELTLGKDGESVPQKEFEQLKSKYNLVKTKYDNWKNVDLETIRKWAINKRGHLANNDDEICECIAIMDRVFNLLTPKWRFRVPQILAVLIFLDSKNRGRLCQIQTGEGKTIIVSLLAVIRVLQGYTVDVITSNSVLADKDKEECKDFYSVFNITVATNNPRNDKICYKADVLYGTISNFQFDYLRETFEGHNVRNNRKFGQVILDEVDSMLIDNGAHIAKLATPYPGMESLRYIYINIWQELQKAEESFIEETQTKAIELLHTYSNSDDAKQPFDNFVNETIKSERKVIKNNIKKNFSEISFIPNHLKDYVERKLDVWIKNALYAKYDCHEHKQYRIVPDDDEEIITPVDYMNTGITMRNTIWSNGLHQFVQLKHNLRLTFESLTSSYISNIGYIRKYKDDNIFGMTGTLGSTAEQNLLSDVYNINYAKIPPYTKKKFQELPGIVVDDDEWSTCIVLEILEKIDEGRAVLVICETVQDLLTIDDSLQLFKKNLKIKKYINEDNAQEVKKKVKKGDAILATNIAGRGTNFKTDSCLEKNGGLHVCVGFLPYNLRVEEQAFGRTSRQGNEGSARLIIRQSEVDELDITEEDVTFTLIKTKRDFLERERLQQVDNLLLKEIVFKDKIFSCFSDLQLKWKRENLGHKNQFLLQDLRERWAFWLDKKNYKADTIKNTTPEEEFENFKYEAEVTIDGQISHNPFYEIGLAEFYLQEDDSHQASKHLEHAIQLSGFDVLTGAHLKLFEIAITTGDHAWQKLKNILMRFFPFSTGGAKPYKNKAKAQLLHAKNAVAMEIEHIEHLTNENLDFQKILVRDEKNYFLKHIYSRHYCLKIHQGNIDDLLRLLDEYTGVGLAGKVPTTTDKLEEINPSENVASSLELTELHLLGIDALYGLKEYRDVPEETLRLAQGQIIGGCLALAAGLVFPPIYPIMQSIAFTLICDGIIELVIAIFSEDNEFNLKEYIKDKFISYAVDIISFGFTKLIHCISVIKAALKFVRKTSNFLRKSTHLKKVCSELANNLGKLEKVLSNKIMTIKFNKLSDIDKLNKLKMLEITDGTKFAHLGGFDKLNHLQHLKKIGALQKFRRLTVLKEFSKKVFRKVGTTIAGTVTEMYVFRPMLDKVFQRLCDKLKESLMRAVKNNNSCMEKIRTSSKEDIENAVKDFLATNEVQDVCEKVITGFMEKVNNIYIECLLFAYNFSKDNAMIIYLKLTFPTYLDDNLQGGDHNNSTDPVIESICEQVALHIFDLIYNSIKTGVLFEITMIKQTFKKPKTTGQQIISQNPSSQEESKQRYYKILNLKSDATVHEAEKEYRKLAKILHPDKNRNDPDATKKFQDLQHAYESILPKKELRDYYRALNLRMDATLKDAKKQYWIMLMDVHPSRHGDDPQVINKFETVETAYKKIVNDLKGIEEDASHTVFVVEPEGKTTHSVTHSVQE